MSKNKTKIYNLVIFSCLTALCYVLTFIMIPLPTGGKVHLGNLVCIISSLLLGGFKGGLIGSIGMGLNDLHFYLDSPSTIIRTVILKFVMGFVCGSLFHLLKKKNPSPNKCFIVMIILGLLILGLGGFSLYVYLIKGLNVGKEVLVFNVLVPICLFILGFSFIISALIFFKKKQNNSYLLISVVLATITNIILEFILKVVLFTLIDRYALLSSLTLPLSQVPASILTGSITVILSLVIYPPLREVLILKYKIN